MGRKILRGILAALATLATLYAVGLGGMLAEWLVGRPVFNETIAFAGLALIVGLVVLELLGRPKPPPDAHDTRQGTGDHQGGSHPD